MDRLEYFPFIQFIGTQRSGSNLLRVMLNQLPEISAPHPPHILKTFYPLLVRYGDLSNEEKFSQLVNDVCHWVNLNPVPWDGIYFKPEDVRLKCKRNTLLEVFIRIHEMKAIVDNASVCCCKSMESVYYVDEIEQSKLKPTYIHIYRDGRDVALSFLKAIVGEKHIYFLAKKWAEEQALCLLLKEKLKDERYISVRYEDLITNPVGEIQRVCSLLNISFSENVLDYFYSNESRNTSSAGEMWSNVDKPIISGNVNKFKKELSFEEIEIFETVAGEMLLKLGYTLHTKPKSKEFSTKMIEEFKMQERLNQQNIIAKADKHDLKKREGHVKFLREITSRSN